MKNTFPLSVSILSILVLMFCFSCTQEEVTDMNPGTTPDMAPDPMDTTVVITEPDADMPPAYLSGDSDYVFDQEALNTYELIIPPANLGILNGDPAAEEYVEGSLVFQGDTISPVGIRYKGSIGAFVGCLSSPDWTNPSGHKTCTKLSMKIKINWEGREDKFYGLNKLQFHSMNQDDSQMRERVGYHLFRSMGVPAPRAVHARLLINGQYNGLFALVEQIDGRFRKERWEDDDGNVYKEAWPLTMEGEPHSEAYFQDALKTNEEEADVSLMRRFAEELSQSDAGTVTEVIERYMDLDEILSYIVVDRMIRHDDGPFHWYCGGGNCTNHNYYWYEEPTNGQLHLITWDLDNSFENIISDANPVTPIADEFGETSNNCRPFRSGLFGLEQWSASCDKLTGGWASYEEDLDRIKAEFKAGVFSQSEVEQLMNEWAQQIREATINASDIHGDAVSEFRWEQGMDRLREQMNFARVNG